MPLWTRIAVFMAVLACSTPGRYRPRARPQIATQSPLSSDQTSRGAGIKLGAQLAIEQLGSPLERMGYGVLQVASEGPER